MFPAGRSTSEWCTRSADPARRPWRPIRERSSRIVSLAVRAVVTAASATSRTPSRKNRSQASQSPAVADVVEQLVVGAPIVFEVQAEVQKRFPEEPGVAQHESDQEAAQATVAVEEGVNGLELNMRQASLDENGKTVVGGMDEPFQVGHALLDVVGWRRNEGRIAGTRAADPVLGSPEFAGHHGCAAVARE